jgi:hypothetical protein
MSLGSFRMIAAQCTQPPDGSPCGIRVSADSSRERALSLDAALVGHTHIIRSSVSSLRIN